MHRCGPCLVLIAASLLTILRAPVAAQEMTVELSEPGAPPTRARIKLQGWWVVTYKLSTKPEGERFMSMGEVTNYDVHYRVEHDHLALANPDGSFTLREGYGSGSHENRAKVRSKQGGEGQGSANAKTALKGGGRLEDDRLDLRLFWAFGPGEVVGPDGTRNPIPAPTWSIGSAWQLRPVRPRDGTFAHLFGWPIAFVGRRSTTIDQGPVAPPLPAIEEVEVSPAAEVISPEQRGAPPVPPTADLAVNIKLPGRLEKGAKGSGAVVVTNQGPHAAPSVRLMIALPRSLHVESMTGCGGGTGSLLQRVCRFPSLSAGSSATVKLEVVPRFAFDVPVAALAHSAAIDTVPDNNLAQATIVVPAAQPAPGKAPPAPHR